MTSPRSTDPASHADHDLALIAALTDRDAADALAPTELDLARARLERCAECAAVHRDLLALTVGLQSAATPSRPRDFRLTPADAARLQPGGLRRFLRSIGSARDGVTRPLAIGLTTLGLVGVLVGTVPGSLSMGGATVGQDQPATMSEDTGQVPSDAAAPAVGGPDAAPGASQYLEMASEDPDVSIEADGYVFNGSEFDQSTASLDTASRSSQTLDDAALRDDASGLSTLVVVAGTMLILGLGLFALRWTSRRFG
jgi:hypothetical protein